MYRVAQTLFVNIVIPVAGGYVPVTAWAIVDQPPWHASSESLGFLVAICAIVTLCVSGLVAGRLGLVPSARAIPIVLSFWAGATCGFEVITQAFPGDLWRIGAGEIAAAFILAELPFLISFVFHRRKLAEKRRASSARSGSFGAASQ